MEIKSREIKIVDIDSIIPNPKNPNTHSKEQIERLCKLIKNTGFRNPLVVSNQSGFLVVGHGRLEAAKSLKMTQIPVLFQDFKNEADEYAYMTADNAIGSWSELDLAKISEEAIKFEELDIEMLGIKDFEIINPEILEPLCDEDEVPEVTEPITKRGDIWILGNHRLMCGDSTMIDDVEKLINKEEIQAVYTDPPYGVSIVSKQYGDGKSHGNGLAKRNKFKPIINDDTTDVAKESYQIIKIISPDIEVIWGANYFTDFLPPSRCWFTWFKKDGLPTDNFADSELAYVNKDKNCKVFSVAWRGMIKQGEVGQKRVHPTQKPVLLAEKCFEYLDIKKSALDLFAGSGSTLIACEKGNIKFFGMELDEYYCDVIINRWQNFTGKKATLESNGKTYDELKNG